MINPGGPLPASSTTACVGRAGGREFAKVSKGSRAGKWLVLYTYPKDFTFVCPTELVELEPDGVVRCASANDLSVGRNVDEVLRVLDGLQTGALTACNWRPGEPTLG